MGNGHPVACLVTKSECTNKFGSNGLKYFNTVLNLKNGAFAIFFKL